MSAPNDDTTQAVAPWVSSEMLQLVLQSAKRYQIDQAQLLNEAGIDLEMASAEGARIAFGNQERLWQAAWEHSGDANFGLQTGIHAQPGNYKLLAYIAMNCSTIGEALAATERYQPLFGGGGRVSILHNSGGSDFHFIPENPHKAITHQRVCAVFAANINILRWLVDEQFVASHISFSAAEPEDTAAYETFFRCPVLFSQTHNALSFNAEQVATAIPNASEQLLAVLRQQAETLLRDLTPARAFSTEVARLLLTAIEDGEPNREAVAGKLGISTRTLQRKLVYEGSSWKGLLDNTRYQLALQYLQRMQLDIHSIANLLGYAEPSAFYRAFKKWHGTTPGQYREQLSQSTQSH